MSASLLPPFIEKLSLIIEQKQLIRLQLTGKRSKGDDLKKIIITAVELKKGYCLNFVYRHATRDITKNYLIPEGIARIEELLQTIFLNAELQSGLENISLQTLPNGKIKVHHTAATSTAPGQFTHDRNKERHISTQENIYLRELGIVNAQGELRREMNDKYRQINKYIELLAPHLDELNLDKTLHIADMGSGKGYLTFALYDYLTTQKNKSVQCTGIEFRQDLVDTCNRIAATAGFEQLNFVRGTIESTELSEIDILIALHACNTATGDAIFRGITAGAELIVCAPCCHKQIRQDMKTTNELSGILKFGILRERQAELLTDGLRAMLMEAYGYKTNVFEFISSVHTPKNVMIVGRKVNRTPAERSRLLSEIRTIKAQFGIEKHYLEELLTKMND